MCDVVRMARHPLSRSTLLLWLVLTALTALARADPQETGAAPLSPSGTELRPSAEKAPPLPAAGRPAANLALGWEYDLAGDREEFLLPDPLPDASVTAQHPFYVRIRAPWARIEPERGRYDWSEVDRIVAPYRAASHVVILCLYGGNVAWDPGGAVPTSQRTVVLKGWLEMLRAAALHFKDRVLYYEIGRAPNLESEWTGPGVSEYAYVLKNSSVTVRSADPAALIAQGALAIAGASPDEALTWQKALYAQDVAPYVDALPVLPSTGADLAVTVSRAWDLLLDRDPAAMIWVVEDTPTGATDRERAADLLRRFVVAEGEGAALVSFDLEADVEGRPDLSGVLLDIHRLFQPGYVRRPGGGVRFAKAGPPPTEGVVPAAPPVEGIRSYRFFDAVTYQGLVAFFATERPADPGATLVLDTAAVKGAALYDLAGGAAGPASGMRPDFKSNTTSVAVQVRTRPIVLLYARVPIEGFEAGKEQVAVADTGLITVEEILAGHQSFMTDQEYRLKHYSATGRVSYHYKISGSNSIDVAYDLDLFWEPQTGVEWRQKALYLNGVRWKGTKFPDIPFVQPEKVLTLPLDIHLDEDYEYEYAGRETVDGYDCYVVDFRPKDRSRALYEGKVWIETRTFARVRSSLVQHGLQPPITSSDERDHFRPVAGPDGTTYWLLGGIEGQQVFTTAGRNLVVSRELELSGFRINDPEFASLRQGAYDSDAPMLRDTDQGLRYLRRPPGEAPVVDKEPPRRTTFAIFGIYDEPGLEFPVPLLGVNYFNYNIGGRNAQLNAFLAGAVNLVTFTDPRLFAHVDGTVEAFLVAIDFTDRYYIAGSKRRESDVDMQPQNLEAWLGTSIGSFFRVRGGVWYEYQQYERANDTDAFVVPNDTGVTALTAGGEFNRSGWTASALATEGRRSGWEPWGDTTAASASTLAEFPGSACDSPGSCFADFDPGQRSWRTYEWTLAKQFFLPRFQKVRLEASWLTGSNLDRFSQFNFSYYSHRVRGLSGAGVRFERGGIARAQYAFNLGDVIRFEAGVDYARIQDPILPDFNPRFTGVGLSGSVLGPWRTLLSFDIGVAVASDYAALKGDTEGQIIFFKFF
jgi:MucB/RseB N-terminal domain